MRQFNDNMSFIVHCLVFLVGSLSFSDICKDLSMSGQCVGDICLQFPSQILEKSVNMVCQKVVSKKKRCVLTDGGKNKIARGANRWLDN